MKLFGLTFIFVGLQALAQLSFDESPLKEIEIRYIESKTFYRAKLKDGRKGELKIGHWAMQFNQSGSGDDFSISLLAGSESILDQLKKFDKTKAYACKLKKYQAVGVDRFYDEREFPDSLIKVFATECSPK